MNSTAYLSQYALCFQVIEYLPDHFRILDPGDDPNITTAFAAGLCINGVHQLGEFNPGWRLDGTDKLTLVDSELLDEKSNQSL